MKRTLFSLGVLVRLTAIIIVILVLAAVVVPGQGDGEKTWDDALRLYERALAALGQTRVQDAIELFEEALGIVRQLGQRGAESAILHALGACYVFLSDYQGAIDYFEQAVAICREIGDHEGEADSLNYLGICYKSLSNFQRAIGYYEQSLAIQREIGNRGGEANPLLNLANCYFHLSDCQRAIGYYQQALAVFRESGDRVGEAKSLKNLGLCYQSLSDYERAIDHFKESLAMQRRIGDPADEADTLLKLGASHLAISDYIQAIDFMGQALAIFRDIGDRGGEAASLANLGSCYGSLSDHPREIAHTELALAIFREMGDRAGEADCLGNLGSAFFALSDYQKAIDYQEQSLAICREIGHRSGEAHALANIGLCFFSLADYQRAIDYHEQALLVCLEIHDRRGEASTLGNLANCYLLLSDYQRAIDCHEQALSVCLEIGDRQVEANSLGSLGNCYSSLADYQRAIGYYEQALAIHRELGDREGEANSLNNLGTCYESLDDYQRAIDYQEQALVIFREIGSRAAEALSLLGLGHSYFFLSNYQVAINYYEQALALSANLGTSETEWRAQGMLGQTARELGDLAGALPHYEAAIAIVEAIRGTVSEEELRQSFFGNVRTLYEEYLELLLDTGRSEETVFVAERLRARTFLDLVAEGPTGPLENVGEEGIRSGVVEALVIEADLAEVVATLPGSTAAIEYFVTEDTTYLWLITGGVTDEPIRIEISRSELRDHVLAFRKAIETSSTGLMSPPDEETFTMSRNLYELLIAPAEGRLDEIDHLIIVPSGPLYYLPFCALLDCEECEGPAFLSGKYLVEHYALSYAPSLTVLKYARALAQNVVPDSLFLALADPAGENPSLQRLPEAQDEAQAAASLFDPSEVYVDTAATEEVLLARASSASQLLLSTHGEFNPQNPMFSYLLVSPTADNDDGRLYAHEVFGLDLHADLVTLSACETLLPALEDATAQVRAVRGGGEDEDVELDERLLATLTAGDEIVGLTRAFICAGTPSVLSTLWKVVSEPTKSLMMAFYGYLEEGMSKVRALQRAQLHLMASYQHPRYWAAFELFGDWGEEPLSADASLFKLSPELLDAWSAWQSQDQEPDDEPPRVAVVMTMTERMTVELLAVISGLSEEIAIKGSFGYFVEVDVPVNLLPTLCGLPEVKSVTPPWVTTNFP